jgi:hypothetical protein
MSLVVSVLQGGTNSHQTTSEEINYFATDFISQGVVGSITSTSGVAPTTGSFAVNAQGSPNMTVAVSTGSAYVTATPTSGNSQVLRVKNSASSNVTIAANATGGTRYDWVYIKIDPDKAKDPAVGATDVASLVTSRSTSATTDNGTPPTYGYAIAVVTVSNGASSITNGNISDKRSQTGLATTAVSNFVYDFISSGCVWTADAAGSTRLASMTAGVVYINGVKLTVAAVTSRTFTASKDVYVDFSDNGDGTAAVTYTDNTTNAASPALAANSVRNAIVVVGASSIAAAASINQGQEDRVLPIASSIPYAVTDSLGNLICPRDPNRKLLGYRRIIAQFDAGTNAVTDVTGLSVPVIVLANRKIKISLVGNLLQSGTARAVYSHIREGSTDLAIGYGYSFGAGKPGLGSIDAHPASVSTGLHTYKATIECDAGANVSMNASSTNPSFLRVELE